MVILVDQHYLFTRCWQHLQALRWECRNPRLHNKLCAGAQAVGADVEQVPHEVCQKCKHCSRRFLKSSRRHKTRTLRLDVTTTNPVRLTVEQSPVPYQFSSYQCNWAPTVSNWFLRISWCYCSTSFYTGLQLYYTPLLNIHCYLNSQRYTLAICHRH